MVIHTNKQTQGQIVHIHGNAQCTCVFGFHHVFVYPAEYIIYIIYQANWKRDREKEIERKIGQTKKERKKCSISSISVEIGMSLLKSPYCVLCSQSSIQCAHSSSHKLLNVSGSYMYFIKISFIRILFNRFDVGDKIYTMHIAHTACTCTAHTKRSRPYRIWQVRRRREMHWKE